MTPRTNASGPASRALSVTIGAQAEDAEQEAAQLIASRLRDELPKLIELLGSSDLSTTLVRLLRQLVRQPIDAPSP